MEMEENDPIVAAQQDGGLLERLREEANYVGDMVGFTGSPESTARVMREAATALAEKDARIAELEAAVAVQRESKEYAQRCCITAEAALTASRAECEGLRAASARDVLAERRRQVEDEGWTPKHDDSHSGREMACAAGIYALIAGAGETDYRNASDGYSLNDYLQAAIDHYWPWDRGWLKPTSRRRDLVKAGALILAEIDRIDRAALSQKETGDAA
jgi:hypothetical protein